MKRHVITPCDITLLGVMMLAGCSGSAKVVAENRLDRPVHIVVQPAGGMFAAAKHLDATIAPGEAVRGWLRVSAAIGVLPDVDRVGVQVSTDDTGPWWVGHLVDQARYDFRVIPGSDGPAVQRRLSSWGLTGWRAIDLKPLSAPWLTSLPEREVPAQPAAPLED